MSSLHNNHSSPARKNRFLAVYTDKKLKEFKKSQTLLAVSLSTMIVFDLDLDLPRPCRDHRQLKEQDLSGC